MLNAMWRMPPCMNIEVSTVAHQGGESSLSRLVSGCRWARSYAEVPWQTTLCEAV